MQQKQQQPPVIFSICTSSDIPGLERWEAHLHPLEQAGFISIWSVRHLQPGADRLKLLRDHLDQATLVVLLLSADFFADEECISLMDRALVSHQQGTARLIPLLLHPVAFRETKLAPFPPIPSDGCPVTLWENPEAAFDDCVRSLRRILGRPVTSPLVEKLKRPSVELQNRERMLQRLRRIYEELFTQSLQGVTQMELGLASKPDAVQNAVTLLLQTATRPEQLLSPGTSILHIYDEAAHDLLILGAPGAGKSTLLVELAQQLVKRAEADETSPLPVIIPLSSWAVKRPPLETWLAEQVARIYDVPKKVARQWVNEDQLLPLLDGLDEMDEAARPACIAAINVYHREHLLLPLVVCSRQVEYTQASRCQRLTLQNAVVVQPLTHEDVQAYLKQGGKSPAVLRHVLAANPALASIATTPFMVHILILTYQDTPLRRSSLQNQFQQQIWTDYMQRMFERKRGERHYSSHQMTTWLSWLARQMREHNQTIFYLEQLQPDWLPKRRQGFYRWSMGLAFGLKATIEPTEVLIWSWRNVKSRRVVVLAAMLGAWPVFGLMVGQLYGLLTGLLTGLLATLPAGLLTALIFGISRKPLIERLMLSPNEGIRRSAKNGLLTGLLAGLLTGLVVLVILLAFGQSNWLLSNWLINGLPYGSTVGLIFGLIFGLGAAIQHYTLRFWLWRTHTFPWRVHRFLDDAVACILLRRVGGGYSFVHRLLMDHLADLPTGPASSNSLPSNNPSA